MLLDSLINWQATSLFIITWVWSIATRMTALTRRQNKLFIYNLLLHLPISFSAVHFALGINQSNYIPQHMTLYLGMLAFAGIYDAKTMMIPQTCSLWAIPLWITLSYFGMTSINVYESLAGAALLYGLFWIVAKSFKMITKRDGMGAGDPELVGMIGSFTGPYAGLMAVNIGTGIMLGLLATLGLVQGRKALNGKFPFGPGLALGGIIVALGQQFGYFL